MSLVRAKHQLSFSQEVALLCSFHCQFCPSQRGYNFCQCYLVNKSWQMEQRNLFPDINSCLAGRHKLNGLLEAGGALGGSFEFKAIPQCVRLPSLHGLLQKALNPLRFAIYSSKDRELMNVYITLLHT